MVLCEVPMWSDKDTTTPRRKVWSAIRIPRCMLDRGNQCEASLETLGQLRRQLTNGQTPPYSAHATDTEACTRHTPTYLPSNHLSTYNNAISHPTFYRSLGPE